jgi:hypothetical protein
MQLLFRLAADMTVICHMGYALFILLGQVAILVGAWRDWRWVRGRRFRLIHLTAILIVVVESLLGIVCPLTTLEKWLRTQAGQATYQGDFLARWIHDLLFVEASRAVLGGCYVAFGLCVALTLWFVPPGGPSCQSEPKV